MEAILGYGFITAVILGMSRIPPVPGDENTSDPRGCNFKKPKDQAVTPQCRKDDDDDNNNKNKQSNRGTTTDSNKQGSPLTGPVGMGTTMTTTCEEGRQRTQNGARPVAVSANGHNDDDDVEHLDVDYEDLYVIPFDNDQPCVEICGSVLRNNDGETQSDGVVHGGCRSIFSIPLIDRKELLAAAMKSADDDTSRTPHLRPFTSDLVYNHHGRNRRRHHRHHHHHHHHHDHQKSQHHNDRHRSHHRQSRNHCRAPPSQFVGDNPATPTATPSECCEIERQSTDGHCDRTNVGSLRRRHREARYRSWSSRQRQKQGSAIVSKHHHHHQQHHVNQQHQQQSSRTPLPRGSDATVEVSSVFVVERQCNKEING